MRSRILAVVAGLAALTVSAWGGIALAGEKDHAASWNWYYEGAIETGRIAAEPPAGVVVTKVPEAGGERVPVVTSGGLAYRLGIDTQ